MAVLWYVSVFIVMLALHEQVDCLTSEKLLIKTILTNYHQVGLYGRPVYDMNDTLDVKFGAALLGLDRVWQDGDTGGRSVKLSLWHKYSWTDVLMTWDPKDYGGVQEIRLPIREIWSPDIKLYNSLDVNVEEDKDILALVQHDGSVLWIPPASVRVRCNVTTANVTLMWQCPLKYGSWTYDLSQLNITFYNDEAQLNLSNFFPAERFTVLSAEGTRNEMKYPCCEQTYGDLTYVLKMESPQY